MISFLQSMPDDLAVDLIGHVLTLLAIIVGVLSVIFQLGRQHRNSLRLQRDNAREELRLRLHEILVSRVRKTSRATVKAAGYVLMIPASLEFFKKQVELGMGSTPPRERAIEFLRLHGEAGDAWVELIEEFESWSIAFPGLQVFQAAINAASYEAREGFTPLFNALLAALPIDPPNDSPQNIPRPIVRGPLSEGELTNLKSLIEKYRRAMLDILSYVHDLTVESQNNLLSSLFDRRVPPRQPIDPKYKVISTDPEETYRLLKYFENETAWGKANQATQESVKAQLGGQ